jgi:hypothetical protein
MPDRSRSRRRRSAGSKARGARASECFVIGPFGGWNDAYYEQIHRPAVEAARLVARRGDDIYLATAIVHDIWQCIKKSRVLLADLTGKNANVFYELGLAHALGKPVVLLAQDLADVPFDLRALRVITFDIRDPQWGDALKRKITSALSEVLSSPTQAVLPGSGKRKAATSPQSTIQTRIGELQSRIDRLTDARSRAMPLEVLDLQEAEEMIVNYKLSGLEDSTIVDRLAERGISPDWVRQTLVRQRARGRKGRLPGTAPKKLE